LPKKVQNKVEYGFDKKLHFHYLMINGVKQPLTGCTTVLNIVSKPALIQWSANMTAEYVIDNFEEGCDLEALCKEAKTAHRKRKENAGDYGNMVHDIISGIIEVAIRNDGYINPLTESKEKSIQNFIEWAVDNKVEFLETEKNIWSEKYFLGGIVDFVCRIDGQIFIGDIKTAKSGIYAENLWQCSGYDIMANDMGLSWAKDIKGYVILNLKESGEFLEKRSSSTEEHKKAFMACLEIYRQKEKTTNQII